MLQRNENFLQSEQMTSCRLNWSIPGLFVLNLPNEQDNMLFREVHGVKIFDPIGRANESICLHFDGPKHGNTIKCVCQMPTTSEEV